MPQKRVSKGMSRARRGGKKKKGLWGGGEKAMFAKKQPRPTEVYKRGDAQLADQQKNGG